MANIFDNLEFSQKVFLKVQYTTILQELDLRKTHGQIVRRLVSEGYKLQEAELLYQRITQNQQKTKLLSDTLTTEIEQQKQKQEDEVKRIKDEYERYDRDQASQRARETKNMPAEYIQQIKKENKERVEYIKLGGQFAADILLKFLGL